jgi:hypothetical protein
MPRIAKADVNQALSVAAKSIIDAGGADGRTSRAEMKAKLAELPKQHRELADIFFKFVDNRDFRAGAQVTKTDVNRAVEYAKKHMIAKYDLNANGLSATEIKNMSLTGKRAVDLAKVLKSAAVPAEPDTGKLSSARLGTEVAKWSGKANYTSESDSNPTFVSAKLGDGQKVSGEAVMKGFKGELAARFDAQDGDLSEYTFETFSAKDAKSFIKGLTEPHPQGDGVDDTYNLGNGVIRTIKDDGWDLPNANAWKELTGLLNQNLTDVKVVKVGPKGEDGSLGSDQGSYAYFVVGKTTDGKLAGITFDSVET